MTAPEVFIVGAPFLDEIHVGEKRYLELGGSAIYAALAAARSGARTALLGRWPVTFKEREWTAMKNLVDVSRTERVQGSPGKATLAYDAQGRTLSCSASPGLETSISPGEIPFEWNSARAVLIPPLGSPLHQLAFQRQVRAGTQIPLIAVSFSPCAVARDPRTSLDLLRECDVAFLNMEEACLLADRENEDLYRFLEKNVRWCVVTMGERGVLLAAGGHVRHFAAPAAAVEDPTGAGDAMAGAVIASLSMGRPIEDAIRYGLAAAAAAVAAPGVRGLRDAENFAPASESSGRFAPVVVDEERLRRLSHVLSAGEFKPFTFTEPAAQYPPVGHPRAAEYFFQVVLHQYGFWNLDGDRWGGSLFAPLDGRKLKGSDFIWQSATKALLAGEADMTRFLDDTGVCPLPMRESHQEFSARFAEWMKENPPAAVLEKANASPDPVKTLLEYLARAPGYAEDPMRKKAMLLAMTLAYRPEKFLRLDEKSETSFGPVVDYHVQRTALRTGIVQPIDGELRERLIDRRELDSTSENAIRRATFEAMDALSRASGVSHPALDLLFFQARLRCPEVGDPDCPDCPFESACAKQKRLFQPVYRTTYY